MEHFQSKDYIVEDLNEAVRNGVAHVESANYTVSELPDGKKGFTIHRARKAMTVDYENSMFIDENGEEMDYESVYKFISALNQSTIALPAQTGFTQIMKGKKACEELYRTVENTTTQTHKLLFEQVKNGFAYIKIDKDYSNYPYVRDMASSTTCLKWFDIKNLERVAPVFLHYMNKEELAWLITKEIWNASAEVGGRSQALFKGYYVIQTMLDYYSMEDIFVYLDEWWVAVQHDTFPDDTAVYALFEGYDTIPVNQANKRRVVFTDIDLVDGSDYEYSGAHYYNRRSNFYETKDNIPDAAVGYYSCPYAKRFFIIPSRTKIEMSIQDFTQMAVYGVIAQGYVNDITTFFQDWRKNLDFQLYFNGQITDITPKNLLSSNKIYDTKGVDEILTKKVSEAYRIKKTFYGQEIRRNRLPVPFEIKNGYMITLASEKDVINEVKQFYKRAEQEDKLWRIWNLFRKDAIPLSLINKDGVVCTRFFDILLLSGETDKSRRHFYYQGRKYECAALHLPKLPISIRNLFCLEWDMPDYYTEVLNDMISDMTIDAFRQYFCKNMKNLQTQDKEEEDEI